MGIVNGIQILDCEVFGDISVPSQLKSTLNMCDVKGVILCDM